MKHDVFNHYNPEQEVFSITNRHKVRQVRRLKSLIQSIESACKLYSSYVFCPPGICAQHHNEWNAILRAKGYGSSWQKWILSFEPVSFVSQSVPELEYLKLVAKITEIDCDAACTQENSRRRANFKKSIQIDNAENFGSFTYKIMRDKETPRLNEVPTEVCTNATLLRQTKGDPCCVVISEYRHFLLQQQASFGKAKVLILKQDDHRVYFRVVEGVIPSSGILSQSRMAITPHEIGCEFKKFWTPIWMRDPADSQFDESYWEGFLEHLDSLDIPSMEVDIRLDDVDQWVQLIKKLPDGKAEGPCGWRYEELKMLPRLAIQDLVNIIQALWQYGFSHTMMSTRVALLSKVLEPRTINDGRPITIMSVIVRIVSKMIFSQTVKVWVTHLPAPVSGGLPNRGVRDLALDQALVIESHLANRIGLCGSSVDLTKAFNLIPRFPLAKVFQKMGLDWSIVQFWLINLSRLTRHPIVMGSLSESVASSTGIPEGDCWSVLGMISLSTVYYFTLATPTLYPYAYADNWSWLSTSAKQNFAAWIRLLNLVSTLHMSIDFAKSWTWGTNKFLKSEVAHIALLFPGEQCDIVVKDAVKDLGEVIVYSKKAWIQPIVHRIAAGVKRIQKIAWIPLDLATKCHKIQMGALSMALYGADRHFVGKSHFHQLRSAICSAVVGHRVYASPWLTGVILSKFYTDPQLLAILTALQNFHRLWFRDKVKAQNAFQLASTSVFKQPFGPSTTLKQYLSLLDLSLKEDGQVWALDKCLFHIGLNSFKEISRVVKQQWHLFVTQQVQHRRGLGGLKFDFSLTQRVFEALDPKHQKLIRMNMVGGFQTKVIQSRWNATVSDKCPLCSEVEDQAHIILTCPALQEVRDRHPEACDVLLNQRPHWIYHPIALECQHMDVVSMTLDSIRPIQDLPPVESCNNNLRFYTDGSCTDPTEPSFRRAAWAVIGDTSPNEEARHQACAFFTPDSLQTPYLSCLATGHVHGFQSIARAELLACTMACKIACKTESCENADIYTDSQYVVNVVWLVENQLVTYFIHKMANPDLVEELEQMWNAKKFRIHKVTSHRTFQSASSVDDLWNILGNALADRAAVRANNAFPNEFKDIIASIRSYRTCEKHRLSKVLEFLVDMNTTRLDLLKTAIVPEAEPCVLSDPLKSATGEAALHAMISYTLPQTICLLEGPLDIQVAEAFLLGSHLASQLWTWLGMLRWPPEDQWSQAPACWGISFLELIINFSQCTGVAMPVTVTGKGSHKEYAGYFTDQAKMLPVSKRSASHQTLALSKAIQTMQTLTKQKVFPVVQRKGCFSMRRLGYVGDALGLPVRPIIPYSSQTMRCVWEYVQALSGKGLHPPLPQAPEHPIIPTPTFEERSVNDRYRAYWRLMGRK